MPDKRTFDGLFLGVGAMKAGTTWLYALLERHPDLFFSFEKEIHYFYHCHINEGVLSERRRLENARDKYVQIDPDKNFANGVRNRMRWVSNYLDSPVDDHWYKNLFVFRRHQKYCCDFSNLHALLDEKGWHHVLASAERLRVLYTLRDPVKRLWSHIKFHLQVTDQLTRLEEWGPEEFVEFAKRPFIWDNAEYGIAIRKMKAVLPAESLKICFFEDIHADPRGFLSELEDFLGIAHFEYPAALIDNRINESVSRPMPDFFPGLFAADVRRITTEICEAGLEPPRGWAAV